MLLQPLIKSLSNPNDINMIIFQINRTISRYTNDHANHGTQQSFANQIKKELIETVWGRNNRYELTQLHDFRK
jgi:predicted methyltransferase